jgi:hypothetical protein
MPSASSFNLHAVTDINGNATGYFISPTFGALTQISNGKLTAIAARGTVTDFSAGLDANGHADVFAHHNGDIQLFDGGTWTDLNQPMAMQQFAAVDGGRAYFVGSDHSLWEFSPVVRTQIHWSLGGHSGTGWIVSGGWQELWGANAVWALDAVTERPNGVNSGRDVVFAIGGDKRLEAFTQGGWYGNSSNQWHQITGGSSNGSPVVNSFSAGLDMKGNAEVYYIWPDGSLDRFDASPDTKDGVGGTFGVLTTGSPSAAIMVDPYATLRATLHGSFFVSDTQTGLVEYEQGGNNIYQGYISFPGATTGIASILDLAAADTNNFFYITSDGHHLVEEMANSNHVFNI